MWTSVLLPLALIVSSRAQDIVTTTDDFGETVAISYSTDDLGETLATEVLSTILATSDPNALTTTPDADSTTSTPTTTTTTTTTTSVQPTPTGTGTDLPPFTSVAPKSGTIINFSQYTKTGLPTTSGSLETNSPNAASSLSSPLSFGWSIPVALASVLGGVGAIWALI